MYHVIKQLEEKQVVIEIDIMLWCDRLDLVAFSNSKGELALHRITWTKAWSLSPPREGSLIKAIAWRPDGKVIAVGYDSNELLLINVENKKVLHTIEIQEGISCIMWTQEKHKNENKFDDTVEIEDDTRKNSQYLDESSKFLPDVPSLSNYSSNVTDDTKTTNFFRNHSELNLLLIGTESGNVLFNIFGCLPCGTIDIKPFIAAKTGDVLPVSYRIVKLHLSDDLSCMTATVNVDNDIKIVVLRTDIFKTHSEEIFAISNRHEKINGLLKYLASCITTLEEIWEGVLLEMDAKLSTYASKVPPGTLSTDFLELLMFGIYSDEMQEFLLRELTLKGLEKFGMTIESSYTNMQALLMNHLSQVGTNICYHLIELRGLTRLLHRFEVLGLNEDEVTQGIQSAGSFLIKGGEMQHILNDNLINYRAFIRWLTMATFYLMDELGSPEIQKRSQQDLSSIAEFLKNFDGISGDNNTSVGVKKRNGFILERLGQYLSDTPLTIESDMSNNLWDRYLAENECLRENPLIIKRMPSMSLVQQYKHLQATLTTIFDKSLKSLVTHITPRQTIDCFSAKHKKIKAITDQPFRITQINSSENRILYAFVSESNSKGFYFVEIDTKSEEQVDAKAVYIYIPDNPNMSSVPGTTTILDVQFYSGNVLSLLLRKHNAQQTLGVLCQLPVQLVQDRLGPVDCTRAIIEQDVVRVSSSELTDSDLVGHVLEMAPKCLAVSGARKVAIVLATNRRSVRIYEMEAEEEDEDEEEEEEAEGDEEVGGQIVPVDENVSLSDMIM